MGNQDKKKMYVEEFLQCNTKEEYEAWKNKWGAEDIGRVPINMEYIQHRYELQKKGIIPTTSYRIYE